VFVIMPGTYFARLRAESLSRAGSTRCYSGPSCTFHRAIVGALVQAAHAAVCVPAAPHNQEELDFIDDIDAWSRYACFGVTRG
jgi:hypothetical protein